MFNILFPMYSLSNYYNELEYFNLSDEEKKNLDYMNECIFNENNKINNASFYIMMMLIELSNDPDKYTQEEINIKKEEIYKDLNEEEIDIMERFIISCINSMGIYSEEEIKLRKERNDK